jgi:hypothetical protein
MAVQTQIQTRRGAAATWTSTNPTLAAGEIGFESDTGNFKIGNGSTAWASLAYNLNGGVSTSGGSTITVASGSTVPLTIQNNGTGNSFVVNDEATDTSNFVIDAAGAITSANVATFGTVNVTSTTASTNGIYLPAANTLDINTNSTRAIRISSTQQVGLGVTPGVTLDIAGTNVRLSPNTNATSNGFIFNGASGNAAWASMQSYRTVIDGSTRFEVLGGGITGIGAAATTAQLLVNSVNTGNIVTIIKGAAGQTADLLQVQNSAGTSLFEVDSAGNVGIGTTSPATYGLLGFGVANSGSTTTNVIGMFQPNAADASVLRIAGYAYTGGAKTTIDFIQNSLSNFQSQIAFSTTAPGNAFAERMRIDSVGTITSTGGGIGYGTGAGGTVTQATSKTTGVTLSKVTGQITMNNAALTADTTVSFTLTNTTIAATDMILVQHISAGTVGAYVCSAAPAAGSATVYVRNVTAGSLSEAIVLQFAIIKAVTA